MCKNLVFMRDIVCKYHPEFRKSADLRKYGIKHNDIFNIERLVEESLAAVGPYNFVDADGYDFSDYSDSKTTSVNQKTSIVTVGSVENKIGALRITAYNYFRDTADYFFVPECDLEHVKSACYGVNEHKQRIQFAYSTVKENYYGWFEEYRVGSFKELALAH